MLVGKITEISGSLIGQTDTAFNGASLVVSTFNAGDSREFAENITYTVKEINSFFGCNQFVIAAVTSIESQKVVSSACQTAFGNSELLFVADTTNNKGRLISMC